MLPQLKQQHITKYLSIPCDTGEKSDASHSSEQQVDIDDITSHLKTNQQDESYISEIVTSQTSNNISNNSKNIIQITKLSQILEAELKSTGRVLRPFWQTHSNEISQKLWCPPLIPSQDSMIQSNYLPGFSNNLVSNSYCMKSKDFNPKMDSQKTLCTSYQFSHPDTNMTNNSSLATKRIRIFPNKEQKRLFNKCFNAHRYMYNKAVADHKIHNQDSHISIRNRILVKNKDNIQSDTNKEYWLKEIPYDTRSESIRNFSKNVKINRKKMQNGTISKFDMKFRSKKRDDDIFYINKNTVHWNGTSFELFKTRLKEHRFIKLKRRQKMWFQNHNHDFFNEKTKLLNNFCTIKRKKDGTYHLYVQFNMKQPIVQHEKDDIVGLDPGVRTFQTFYSEKMYGKLGDKTTDILMKYNKKIDNLTSVLATHNVSKRIKKGIKKRCGKLRAKVENIVSDLHWKAASFLAKHFKTILLPTFETKKMVERKKAKRKINNTTARNMMSLSHYKFKLRLKHLATKYGSLVIDCDESYTSKTCGQCGKINNSLGSKDVFDCNDCKLRIDRDVNGARNVLIRSVTKYMGYDATP